MASNPRFLRGQNVRRENLFALLSLEKPPENPDNNAISGTPEKFHRR